MAVKMIRTVFPAHRISSRDQDLLLHLATICALEDLLQSGMVEWEESPPALWLRWKGKEAETATKKLGNLPPLKPRYSDRESQRVLDALEEIFDRYDLPEIERATLLTALPCVGLHALRSYLKWRRKPPFPELG